MKSNLFTPILLIMPFLSWGQDAERVPYIQNDTFVANAFGFPVTIQNLKKNYSGILSISKKPVRNKHDNAFVDTVYTFTAGKTKMEIYKTRHRDILQSA